MKADEKDKGADKEKLLLGDLSPITSNMTCKLSSSTHEYPCAAIIYKFLNLIWSRFAVI